MLCLFSPPTSAIVKKAETNRNAPHRSWSFRPKTVSAITLVRPELEYATAVWSPYTKENIGKIEKFKEGQPHEYRERVLDHIEIDRIDYCSMTDMLSNLGWWSLENRCIDARLTMFYKIVYSLVAIPLPSYFVRAEVYTRHMHSLSYGQIHTSVC